MKKTIIGVGLLAALGAIGIADSRNAANDVAYGWVKIENPAVSCF